MRGFRFHSTAVAVALAVVLTPPARAGQVTITVGGPGGEFSPASPVYANTGDHIIWIWADGFHTVSSTGFVSFDSGFGSGKQFAIRVLITGTIPYTCGVHGGTPYLYINPSGTPVANMRITEVEFAAGGDLDRVQVANLGAASGPLGFYRVSSQSGVTSFIDENPILLAPGQRVTLHLGAGGPSTATEVFLPLAAALGSVGSFALYVPNNTTAAEGSSNPGSLTDSNQMLDYVEWGNPGQPAQPNEVTATYTGKWAAGTAVDVTGLPNGGTGYSISFCGGPTDRGASFWHISIPNFGLAAACSTPARPTTWGRVKLLYR